MFLFIPSLSRLIHYYHWRIETSRKRVVWENLFASSVLHIEIKK